MEKKALQLASVASMIDQFNMPNIMILLSLGYKVDVVADFTNPGNISEERAKELIIRLKEMGVRVFDIAIPRSLNLISISKAYNKVKNLIVEEHYNLIHCHSPIGGAICRFAAKGERKNGTNVIYTAHGFHFYKGAPLKNWIIYYPIEKILSKYTDILITINNDDYVLAVKKFFAKKTVKIPGVGVNCSNYNICKVDNTNKRLELDLLPNDFVILFSGTTLEYSCQKIIVDSLISICNNNLNVNIVFLFACDFDCFIDFKYKIVELGLADYFRFLGKRNDFDELCEISDCLFLPLGEKTSELNTFEALSAGLPLISYDVNNIYVFGQNGFVGSCFNLSCPDSLVSSILSLISDTRLRDYYSIINRKNVLSIDLYHFPEIMNLSSLSGYKHLSSLLSRLSIRYELGISIDDFVIVSVGELNENKNHQIIIRSLSKLNDKRIKYIIVGKGALLNYLKELSQSLGVSNQVIFTGYRTDIRDILYASDCFAFPSKREGLGIAALEGLAAGLPVIGHNIGGIKDYVINDQTGWLCDDIDDYMKSIIKCKDNHYYFYNNCINKAASFDVEITNTIMRKIYNGN